MRKITACCFSATLAATLLASVADAKTLYVNSATGNDATTYDNNSAASPWKSIGRATWGSTSYTSPNSSQAAKAGDVVQIADGIYWETGSPSGDRFTVSLNPANNGTAANPITYRGIGNVYVRMRAGYRGGMIGCNGRNYIIWDNFQIDDYYGGSTSDTGPVIFSGGAQYCQLINSTVTGHPGSYYNGYPTFGGNYRGVSIEPANHITIRNNLIRNFRGSQNEAGVMTYDSNDNVIENNDITGNGSGVFIKGVHAGATQARNIIRKNLVWNNETGIRVLGSEDARVYQNIVTNNTLIGLWAGFSGSTRTQFVNNTLYNNDRAFVPQGPDLVGVRVFGNIASTNTNFLYNWDVGTPTGQDVSYDRNVYFQNANHANYESGLRLTFAVWQSQYRLDLNSRLVDPQFVNAADEDFRLQASSPARNASIDILDLNNNGSTTDVIPAGAYVTGNEVIGRSTGAAPPVPSPPENVVVE